MVFDGCEQRKEAAIYLELLQVAVQVHVHCTRTLYCCTSHAWCGVFAADAANPCSAAAEGAAAMAADNSEAVVRLLIAATRLNSRAPGCVGVWVLITHQARERARERRGRPGTSDDR